MTKIQMSERGKAALNYLCEKEEDIARKVRVGKSLTAAIFEVMKQGGYVHTELASKDLREILTAFV